MNSKIRLITLLACAGASTAAFAQDSVSANLDGGNGMPGDALKHWESGVSQRSTYVVDLTQITTSWGTKFRVGPIMKGIKLDNATDTFFDSFWNASVISQTILQDRPSFSSSYSLWTTPGAGISDRNAGSVSVVAGPAATSQFAISGVANGSERPNPANSSFVRFYKGVVGAVVNFDEAAPNRLYVTRVQAADTNLNGYNTSISADLNRETAQFGNGSVDASGFAYFRSDSNGIPAGQTARIAGNNVFRVNLATRNTSPNIVAEATGVDATDQTATTQPEDNYGATITGVMNIPAAFNSGVPKYIAADFNTQFKAEGLSNTNAHAAGKIGRGSVTYLADSIFAGTSGTGAQLMRDTSTGGVEDAFSISVWGLSDTGAVSNTRLLRRPAGNFVDNIDGYVWGETTAGASVFRHYQGLAAFNAGSQVALCKLSDTSVLAAGVVYEDTYNTLLAGNPSNALVAAKFDPTQPNGTPQWGIVAWTDFDNIGTVNGGKAIYSFDGTTYTQIGRLANLIEVTGASPVGPSISNPVFDSKGNCWFLAGAELFNRLPGGGSDFDTVLIRGVYDPANHSWRLELVLEPGTTIRGQNSDRDYRITFLELAYVGSGTAANGAISPGSLWAGSGMQKAWNNTDPSTLAQSDSKALGGLVLNATVTYDVGDENGVDGPDGFFDNPTGTSPQYPNSRDEAYHVVLYVGADVEAAPSCPADFNADTVVDFFDYLDFVAAFSSNDPTADFNADTVIDFFDYLDFVAAFSTGC
jgi:hypothetical protein